MHIINKKMPKYNKCCFVYGCFSTSSQNRHLGFHKFPHNNERIFLRTTKYGIKQIVNRRQLWMEALNIGKGASYTVDDMRICSLHFAKSDFYQSGDSGLWFLKKTAVPRRNLPTRWSSPLTTRFSVRSSNRLKYRGYFTIHNPDGRKLTVRRQYLGENYNKQNSNTSSYQKTVWIARKPPVAESTTDTDGRQDFEKESEDNTGWQGAGIINAHSLADKTEFSDDNKDISEEKTTGRGEDCTDDDITCTGTVVDDETTAPEAPWSPSEVIIKEEVISDSEDEFAMDGKLKMNKDLNLRTSESEDLNNKESELDEDVEIKDEENETFGEVENTSDVEEEEEEESYEEENYDNVVEGIDCKVCGQENCQGHPGSRPKENVFVCLVCSEIFSSKKQLGLHSKIHDEASAEDIISTFQKSKDLTCHVCGRTLSTRATLREHIMIHTGEKPYKCQLCGKSFRHKANLVVHVNAHTVVNSFNCSQCGESFSRRSELEKHVRGHLYSEYVCNICNSKFKSQRTLYNHSVLHTKKGEVRKKKSGGKPKGKPHVCKLCGKILSTSATLREHMLIHSGEKPHVCLLCGKTVRHKANFVVHVQSHSRGQSFECNICEDAFLKKSDLRQHKLLMHSQIKIYTCPICAATFKSIAKFNEHAETHTTEEVDQVAEQQEEYEVLQPHLLEAFLTES